MELKMDAGGISLNQRSAKVWAGLILFILILAAFYNFLVKSSHIISRDDLLALDPYLFSAQTQWLVDHNWKDWSIAYWVPKERFFYPPGLIIATGAIHQLGLATVNDIYRWFGAIQTALFVPILYWALRGFFDRLAAVFGSVAFAFAPYVMTRGVLTLPENLALLFMIVAFGFFARKWWLAAWVVALLALITHFSAIFIIAFGLAWSIVAARSMWYKGGIIVVALILALLGQFYFPTYIRGFSSAVALMLSASWGFHWPGPDLAKLLGLPLVYLSAVGLVLTIGEGLIKKTERSRAILIFLIPMVVIAFFFIGQRNIGFGPILPERFGILEALAAAMSAAFLFDLIAGYSKIAVLLSMLAIILSSHITPWFWVFNPEEVQAADWLKNNSRENSLVVSQPLISWLIRSRANRFIIANFEDQSELILGDLHKFREKINAPEWKAYDHYLFYLKNKNNQYETQNSEGAIITVGYPKTFLPRVDENILTDGEVIYENQSVQIYKLFY